MKGKGKGKGKGKWLMRAHAENMDVEHLWEKTKPALEGKEEGENCSGWMDEWDGGWWMTGGELENSLRQVWL